MNRRGFFKFLGLAPLVAAVAPKLLTDTKQTDTVPLKVDGLQGMLTCPPSNYSYVYSYSGTITSVDVTTCGSGWNLGQGFVVDNACVDTITIWSRHEQA